MHKSSNEVSKVLRDRAHDELVGNSLLKTLQDCTGTAGTWRDALLALADVIDDAYREGYDTGVRVVE